MTHPYNQEKSDDYGEPTLSFNYGELALLHYNGELDPALDSPVLSQHSRDLVLHASYGAETDISLLLDPDPGPSRTIGTGEVYNMETEFDSSSAIGIDMSLLLDQAPWTCHCR